MTTEKSTCLYIDIGNTYIKWKKQHCVEINKCLVTDLATNSTLYQQIALSAKSIISCTPHHPHLHPIKNTLKDFPIEWINQVPDNATIQLAYQQNASFGIDRYLSLLAVRDDAPLIMVDLGTAITIDMMNNPNNHLGGWILPGLTMVKQQFQQYGLNTEKLHPTPQQLGDSTTTAINNGYYTMLTTFLNNLAVNNTHWGINNPTLILTGGDAPQINQHLAPKWQVKEGLVLIGLSC
jgi:type III pantothenate kinase